MDPRTRRLLIVVKVVSDTPSEATFAFDLKTPFEWVPPIGT
jgi:hypothetical protein